MTFKKKKSFLNPLILIDFKLKDLYIKNKFNYN